MDFSALDRARSRLSWSRRELERFEQTADEGDPRAPRIRRKLQEDVEKAERDLRYEEDARGAVSESFGKLASNSPTGRPELLLEISGPDRCNAVAESFWCVRVAVCRKNENPRPKDLNKLAHLPSLA